MNNLLNKNGFFVRQRQVYSKRGGRLYMLCVPILDRNLIVHNMTGTQPLTSQAMYSMY